MSNYEILPTLFALDLDTFERKLNLTSKFSKTLHIDICDGEFVPTKTVQLEDINCIKKFKNTFEVHLMCKNPLKELEKVVNLKISRMLIHFESFSNLDSLKNCILKIKEQKINVTLVVNPETPIGELIPILSEIDSVMVMSVHPGLEGQSFIEKSLERIRSLKMLKPSLSIKVDGGIKVDEVKKLKKVGAEKFCIGSFISSSKDALKNYNKLQKIIF